MTINLKFCFYSGVYSTPRSYVLSFIKIGRLVPEEKTRQTSVHLSIIIQINKVSAVRKIRMDENNVGTAQTIVH